MALAFHKKIEYPGSCIMRFGNRVSEQTLHPRHL